MKIEEVICQCEAVAHCAVVGRKNTAKGYDTIRIEGQGNGVLSHLQMSLEKIWDQKSQK